MGNLIRVKVACATNMPDALFCIEARLHKEAELEIQQLDLEISKRSIAEETLFAAINAAEDDFTENGEEINPNICCIELEDRVASYLDEFIPMNEISIQDARDYWDIIHKSRMGLYVYKEESKERRKKAFHNMKRLSFLVLDKTCNAEFIKAFQYYNIVAR